MVDEILKEMSPQFAKLYSEVGRPSIAPERLFRSLLLQIFYSVRSERMLIEQLQYNLLFRWFVGMEMDEAVWNHAVYSKNRERLLNEEIAEAFFRRVLERARPYLSDEHFTVDGTLIEAWASQKSFRRKDGQGKPPGAGGEVDFSRGEAEEPDPWILQCTNCDGPQHTGSLFIFNDATATVTSLGDGDHDGDDPVSTPEPSSLISLSAGCGHSDFYQRCAQIIPCLQPTPRPPSMTHFYRCGVKLSRNRRKSYR